MLASSQKTFLEQCGERAEFLRSVRRFFGAFGGERSFFGACGGERAEFPKDVSVRQGVLITEDTDGPLGGYGDRVARVTYERGVGQERRDKVEMDGQT